MSNCAKISLTGRLTKDPTKTDWKGTPVVSFTVAVNTTKKENEKYISDFYNVSVWGNSANFILPKISKGSMVQVYGDLVLQEYKDKNNEKQKSLSVRAVDVIQLSPKKEASAATEEPQFPF